MSFSVEKDEIFRDEELRKHPFWISGDSKGGSDRGRMVDVNIVVDGCSCECSKENGEKEEKKQASIRGTQALLKRRL